MRRQWIPQVIAIAFLLWAFNRGNPYSYYIVLRWVLCSVFVYLSLYAFNDKQNGWAWIMGTTAILYNPIFRVHLSRSTWEMVNVLTILIALVSVPALRRRTRNA